MSKEQIIKKITINIAGTEVEVTPQQAKDLHSALGDLLNLQPPVVNQHIHYDRYNPYPYYWPYRYPTWTAGGTITSDSGTSGSNKWTASYSNNSVNLVVN